ENFAEVVFNLITWAEAHGRLEQLISSAREENPGNEDLQIFDAQLTSSTKAASQDGETDVVALAESRRADLPDAQPAVTPDQRATARQRLLELGREYVDLRASMKPGNPRTQQMEGVATKMRMLAIPDRQLVDELSRETSAGHRLAAVMLLQE